MYIFFKNKYYYCEKKVETPVERSRNDRGRGGQKPAKTSFAAY